MSERFEREIQDWYDHSRIANLEYLDLETNQLITKNFLAHNQLVIYNRLSLTAKICVKRFHQVIESHTEISKEVKEVSKEQRRILKVLKSLEEELTSNKFLSKEVVKQLVSEIAKRPKPVEEEALKLISELRQQVKDLALELKEYIAS